MSSAIAKPSREVSTNLPSRSSFFANASAWTRMSSEPDLLAPAREDAVDVRVVLDVARLDERRADAVRERPDALLDHHLDRREADLATLLMQRLGDAPGDGVVVGDAEYQRLLAG